MATDNEKNTPLFKDIYDEELVNSLKENKNDKYIDIITDFLDSSLIVAVPQAGYKNRRVKEFTLTYNNKRVGLLYVGKSVYLKFGMSGPRSEEDLYNSILNSLFDDDNVDLDTIKDSLLNDTRYNSEHYLREPIQFSPEILEISYFFNKLSVLGSIFYYFKYEHDFSSGKKSSIGGLGKEKMDGVISKCAKRIKN